jgi:long-chain acyl-CoA synthetase
MYLFNSIKQNKTLLFIDAKTKEEYVLSNILFNLNIIEKTEKQLVFLYCKNQIHSVGMYLSLLKGNFTIALLNEELNESLKIELEYLYRPSIIIDDARVLVKTYKKVAIQSNTHKTLIFLLEKNKNINIHHNVKILLSTSGTTGSPKFVKLSEENIFQNTISIVDYLPIIKEDVTPLNLPIFYSYGLSVLHTNATKGGVIVCNTDDVLSKNFWRQFEEFGFTSIAGVPFLYEMLDRIGFRKKQYPTLRYISQAGGHLNRKIKQQFFDYCLENSLIFYVMYGQTEASARISYVQSNRLSEKINSIGKAILNGKLILDSETQELLYEGPNIFGGYASSIVDLSIWENIKQLHTGDLAEKDKDGFYFITGRIKRFIKAFGSRINLDELELLLKLKIEGINFACI